MINASFRWSCRSPTSYWPPVSCNPCNPCNPVNWPSNVVYKHTGPWILDTRLGYFGTTENKLHWRNLLQAAERLKEKLYKVCLPRALDVLFVGSFVWFRICIYFLCVPIFCSLVSFFPVVYKLFLLTNQTIFYFLKIKFIINSV